VVGYGEFGGLEERCNSLEVSRRCMLTHRMVV
jgi:hypothetical protein